MCVYLYYVYVVYMWLKKGGSAAGTLAFIFFFTSSVYRPTKNIFPSILLCTHRQKQQQERYIHVIIPVQRMLGIAIHREIC